MSTTGPTPPRTTQSLALTHVKAGIRDRHRLLGIDPDTIREPRPGVVTARSLDGDLVTVDVRVYRKGQW